MWYQKFDTFIRGLGFTRSKADHCVYFKLIGDRVFYLVLYVDDMLLVGNDKEIIQDLKTQLSSKFDMKDLGAANYILGMEIKRDQCPKTQEEEEDMSCVPYASEVSSLMYAMVCTIPNIAHVVGVLSRFMSKPRKEHWTTVKQVFRYLRGTSDYGLCYQGRSRLDKILDIHGFVYADYARDLDQRKSTSGYVFNLFGGTVSWMNKKQFVVALSATEAEYMAATHVSKEVVWLQRLCSSMGLVQGAIRLDCGNQGAIFLAKNPVYHSKTKHNDVQYHFVRDMIEDKKVLLVKVDTLKNTADALTKSVSS
eukprot:PITA_27996